MQLRHSSFNTLGGRSRVPRQHRVVCLLTGSVLEQLTKQICSFSSRCESLFVKSRTAAHIDLFHSRSETTARLCRSKYLLGSVRYSVTDVAGEPSERTQSWRTACSTADYVIYTAALSGHCRRRPDHNDLVCRRGCRERTQAVNNHQNQMRDAMSAFENITTSATFPIVLLFTKKDVFVENLKVQPFSDFFPEYTGMMDSTSICAYISTMFQRLDKRSNGKLYIRFVNATDPDDFKEVFKEIETNMLKHSLRCLMSNIYHGTSHRHLMTL